MEEENINSSSGSLAAASKIAILLCTYHGQSYLAEQLDSFAAQSYSDWEVWASDDGSRDQTRDILETYRERWQHNRLSIHSGPQEGFAANFLSLVCKATIQADFYAYSDQDDIWEPDKLQRAMEWLSSVPADTPALYCSRTRLVDAANCTMGLSPLFTNPPRFANALVQNVGGGNTMVFNKAARDLLQEAGEDINAVSHDWWAYMVVSGCGGQVRYDPTPAVRYRQHGANIVGMNSGWKASIVRIRMLLKGRFKDWNDRNIRSLQRLAHRLTPENKQLFEQFCDARKRRLIPRVLGLMRSGVYRQTKLGNAALFLGAILNKI